ncbi:MAG: hypothetical protein PHC40_03650 [Eubacteriales bacterium]|nr:hypothetical protein [Eubacteriales bacterium]
MSSVNYRSMVSLLCSFPNLLNEISCKYPYDYKQKFELYFSKLPSSAPANEGVSEKEPRLYRRSFTIRSLPFLFLWNIEEIDEIIKSTGLQACDYNVHGAFETTDISNIFPDMLHRVSSDPIIVGEIPFSFPREIVLDGNHRVTSAYLNKKNSIKAYILSPHIHTRAMPTELAKTFLMLCNIQSILQHIEGIITLEELNLQLYDIE